jgi:hypothetical protein
MTYTAAGNTPICVFVYLMISQKNPAIRKSDKYCESIAAHYTDIYPSVHLVIFQRNQSIWSLEKERGQSGH